jgi:hypothetical protein
MAQGAGKRARVDPHPATNNGTQEQEDTGLQGPGGPAAAPDPHAPGEGGEVHPDPPAPPAPAPAIPEPAAPGGGGGAPAPALAPGVAPALVLPDPGGDFRAARVHLLRLLRQVRGAGGGTSLWRLEGACIGLWDRSKVVPASTMRHCLVALEGVHMSTHAISIGPLPPVVGQGLALQPLSTAGGSLGAYWGGSGVETIGEQAVTLLSLY